MLLYICNSIRVYLTHVKRISARTGEKGISSFGKITDIGKEKKKDQSLMILERQGTIHKLNVHLHMIGELWIKKK